MNDALVVAYFSWENFRIASGLPSTADRHGRH